MQAAYRQNPDRVIDLVIDTLREKGLLDGEVTPEQRAYVGRVVAIMGERLRVPRDILTYGDFFFQPRVEFDPQAIARYLAVPGTADLLRNVLNALAATRAWDPPGIESAIRTAAARLGVQSKSVIHPLRVALTGKTVGPGLFELIDVLGKDRVLERLERAIGRINEPPAPAPR